LGAAASGRDPLPPYAAARGLRWRDLPPGAADFGRYPLPLQQGTTRSCGIRHCMGEPPDQCMQWRIYKGLWGLKPPYP